MEFEAERKSQVKSSKIFNLNAMMSDRERERERERERDGWMDGWMDGWTDRQTKKQRQ